MNKQQLANKIWESANKMRSKIEANEYKDYILGFIFYKYLSDNEVRFLRQNSVSDAEMAESLVEEDSETTRYVQTSIGYYIAYRDLFSTWIAMGRDFDVSNVREALSAFSRLINPTHKKVFEGIFDTLQTGLSKLGESAASQTKAISDLIHLIKDIPMDGKQDYDVLGFIYEYLISMFAANAGKKAGEFYTPHEVSLLMSEIVADHLKNKSEIEIYDPTSGSGSLLITIGQSVAKHMADSQHIKYYAQELKQNTYNLTRMNLVMRGIRPDNLVTRNGDTLEDDWPYFDDNDRERTYQPLYVDAVVSNPPYSQNWEPAGKEANPRFARFGLAPKSKADYAFLLHDLYHIKPDGIMTIVLPHGVLFRGGEEGEIRKNLVEANHIDAIIGLPANIFFGTGIPTIIMVLRQRRANTDVLIADASKGFEKVGKNNKLRASDIRRIADTVMGRAEIVGYSRRVSRDQIRQNDYNLNIPRYVDSSVRAESWDIYASMFGGIPQGEIDALGDCWAAFPTLRDALFTADAYASVNVPDVKAAIHSHPAVAAFRAQFAQAFEGWPDTLKARLMGNMETLALSKEEASLSADIFNRLQPVPLIDPYEAYQLLDDEWSKISVDLEIIQTEGREAIRRVEPHMVLKKKDGKDQEVQDGWAGRIIPFALVQETLLKPDADALKAKESRLAEITAQYDELLDAMTEEEKDGDEVNDSKDGFIPAAVLKTAKRLLAERPEGAYPEDSFETRILTAAELLTEEKTLKAQVKADEAALHLKTKTTIEALTEEQAAFLIERKWIAPLVASIYRLPDGVLQTLETAVQALADKYATTFAAVEAEIHETEKALAAMIGELEGSAFDKQGLSEFQALLLGGRHE
ncbi:MAG: type I restriction-modification system subunit M [Candidatus Limiplasma sp.]|nr:type I restriction-modification system subunit M [Candidatus Limiplasma sp.]